MLVKRRARRSRPRQLSLRSIGGLFKAFVVRGGRLITGQQAALQVHSSYGKDDEGSINLRITNTGVSRATVTVLDAYTGYQHVRQLRPGESLEDSWSLERFHGWYDLIVKVSEDPSFERRLAGHIETGNDSFSDPALGGLVALTV